MSSPASSFGVLSVGSALGTGSSGPADGSVSKVMIGEPTSTVSPAWWWISVTTPAKGDGTSTAALAVSTSTMTWLSFTSSPTATIHCRISPSVSPSPRSGSLNCFSRDTSVPQRAVDGVQDPVEVRQVLLLDPRRRVGGVEAGHAQHRGLHLVVELLGQPRRDLRAEADEGRGLVHHDRPAGAPHGLDHGGEVQRGQRAQVDDLER